MGAKILHFEDIHICESQAGTETCVPSWGGGSSGTGLTSYWPLLPQPLTSYGNELPGGCSALGMMVSSLPSGSSTEGPYPPASTASLLLAVSTSPPSAHSTQLRRPSPPPCPFISPRVDPPCPLVATASTCSRYQKQPAIVVSPLSSEDIAFALSTARRYRLQVSAKGGGHNPAGIAVPDGELPLKTSLDDVMQIRGVEGMGRAEPGDRLVPFAAPSAPTSDSSRYPASLRPPALSPPHLFLHLSLLHRLSFPSHLSSLPPFTRCAPPLPSRVPPPLLPASP